MTAAPTDPTYPAFPLFSFLGFVLVLIPLPWHFQAWNSGTCLFMIWVSISCLIGFVNSIIWGDSIADVAPIWCDISTRIMVAVPVAIPAASLCINRRLYNIARCQTVSTSKAEKRRAVLVDLAIGLGIPFLQMPLQFIVQGHRYNIIENVGCYPTTYNVVPAYPLSYLWPNLINLTSACYALLTLRAFLHRRAQFAQFLSPNTGLTPTRYFRLMALASLELLLNMPIATYGLYLTASRSPVERWVSWADTHADFYYIGQVPAIIWRSDRHAEVTVELSRWSSVICAFVFFGFFGFAAEARKHYKLAFWAVARRCGVRPPPDGAIRFPWSRASDAGAAKAVSLPTAMPLTPVKQRLDSLYDSRGGSRTDCESQVSFEKDGRGCEYIVPSPSPSSTAFSPPLYSHDIEAGAYVAYPSVPRADLDCERALPPLPRLPTNPPDRPRPATWHGLRTPTFSPSTSPSPAS
ncbi:STE3-like pheromone receptor [Favolaschia claudopus]|uniref:STE3-like pheromone receptor n=1 Tax=Favolaschia claudopus TaxID=2862362 RepID=A0AAW0BTW2_9AGAR